MKFRLHKIRDTLGEYTDLFGFSAKAEIQCFYLTEFPSVLA